MRHGSSQWSRCTALLVLAMLMATEATTLQAQYFRFGKNKVQYEAERWSYLESDHFDIYYYEGGFYLADFTAKAAEAAYAQISDLFQHQISKRIPLIVYQSHNDFGVTNAVDLPTFADGIGGVTELFKNRIAIPFTGDYRDYRRVVHHELVHAVLNDMFYGGSIQSIIQNNIQLRIPLWFNEGLSEYAALGWDTQSDMYVREAILEDHLANIEQLRGYFAYRGGQGVWDYIAEQYGREKVGELLQRLRLTRSVDDSFRRATGLSVEELSKRWHKTLQEIYFPEVAAREDLDEIARALITRDDGFYNTSPALSPQGDKVAFITTRSGLFDVYLADANDGKVHRKLIDGQTSPEFESLRILTPGLSWSPDGRQLAVAVKSGATDAIAVVDVYGQRTTHYRIPGVDQIIAVAWNPQGGQIAFEASMDAQSDIYVLDLATRETFNYTNDLFSDHEPAWSPDGKALVFHSDRGNHTALGRYRTHNFEMIDHDYSQFDLYRLPLGGGEAPTAVERLTFDPIWDDMRARFGNDPEVLVFISDRNGIPNLYEKNLTTGVERPLTDLTVGVTQVSLSADGRKAALVSLHEGTPSIYVMNTPFERRLDQDVLAPNLWAQRVMQDAVRPAPALLLASSSRLQSNPFMRDATDGVAFVRQPQRRQPLLLASRTDFPPLASPPTLPEGPGTATDTASDTTEGIRIDFRNYQFGQPIDDGRDLAALPMMRPFSPEDNIDANGRYKPRQYKLRFSPDLVYGTAGYDVLYGVQGVTQMTFSDMLGNHRILVATNLLIDLRNSDYIISYSYLPRRTDWTVSGFHVSRLLPDFNRAASPTYYRYRHYGFSTKLSYPLNKFRRVDVDFSILGVSQADITDATEPSLSRTMLHPSVTYTKDVTTPGFMFPASGHRVAFSIAGSPLSFHHEQIRFLTLLADARVYTSFGRGAYTFAFRTSGGTSLGRNQQLFYTSGVQNWVNRTFDPDNGFPIADVTDFIFATPMMPLRGYDINARNGSHFGLINAEFRFPLVAAILPGPLPFIPFYNIQGVTFLDVGTVWGGRGADARFNVFHRNTEGSNRLDDLLVGSGFGLRTLLFGYPLRLDWAWPYDGHTFGDRQLHFSIGFDF